MCPSDPVISHGNLIELKQNNTPLLKQVVLFIAHTHTHLHTKPSLGTTINRQDGKCNSRPISNWSNVFSVTVGSYTPVKRSRIGCDVRGRRRAYTGQIANILGLVGIQLEAENAWQDEKETLWHLMALLNSMLRSSMSFCPLSLNSSIISSMRVFDERDIFVLHLFLSEWKQNTDLKYFCFSI